MPTSLSLYREPLGLLTDLYQLTMAYGYWKLGLNHREGVFCLTFRQNPFRGGFAVAAGLEYVIDYLQRLAFEPSDITYLATLTGNDGTPLFDPSFLDELSRLRFTCDLDAVPEGTVVFPQEPLLRVRGPLLECQIIETALLNMVNFQTLVATKAARVCLAARDDPVLEFGLRRAQGIDGAISASRAAYLGGCSATSNVLAGKLFGIPVKGTHAHSWVMCFDSELDAFHAYAKALPNNCVFLVDTFQTIAGIRHAIEVGKALRAAGHALAGIRLDSGDLAYLSIEARKMLDAAGFHETAILATNDLDEEIIRSLKEQGAAINSWGVGTKLVTAFDQPALGGVYKLTAVRDGADPWQYKIKLSEQQAKTSTPGVLQVRRYRLGQEYIGDMIFDEATPPSFPPLPPSFPALENRKSKIENVPATISSEDRLIIDPLDPTRRKAMPPEATTENLLVPIFRAGQRIYDPPPLVSIRQRVRDQLAAFHPGIKRFVYPHQYPVGLEHRLHELRNDLILHARGLSK